MSAKLRKFGLTIAVPIALFGSYLAWKGLSSGQYVLAAAATLTLMAILAPNSLKYVELVWMKIAEVMSWIMTRIILTFAFYFVFFPFGLMLRLMGKDLLQFRIDKSRTSYWEPVEEGGPQTRPDKPF